MNFREIIEQLNIRKQCKKYGLSIWRCPQFVFLIMGVIIVFSTLFTYAISSKFIEDPLLISLIVIFLTWLLLILSYLVTQSFERLAEASRMKIEFLTIMSHQIRAPFANMRWVTDLLLSKKSNISKNKEQEEEYLLILRENSQRLEELINKIITVSKIEQGKFPLRKDFFDFKELINKVILEFKSYAEASNVKVIFDNSQQLPKILGDASQIREVVENFVDNAIKYTKDKGEVKISLSKVKSNKDVHFEIKDSGVGIPKEDQKYIFQKFFRSKSAMKHQTQGSGLGLFIVKSIIESHNGKVGFVSEEGKGTTFWFTLPVLKK